MRLGRPIILAAVVASRSLASVVASAAAPVCDVAGPQSFVLRHKRAVSPDSFVLTFALPPAESLGRPAPSGVKVLFNATGEDGAPATLEKSYSPVSLPDALGEFELLVKVMLSHAPLG